MRRSARCLGLVVSLPCAILDAQAADWQHDLVLPGQFQGRLMPAPINPRADGIDLLVNVGGARRTAALTTGQNAIRWTLIDSGLVPESAHNAVPEGWLTWRIESGFPMPSQPCEVALRGRDGRVSALQLQLSSARACTDAVPLADGLAVLLSFSNIVAVGADGTVRWTLPLAGNTRIRQLVRSADGSLVAAGDSHDGNVYSNLLLRVDAASGAILDRWDDLPSAPRFLFPALRAAADNGVQVLAETSDGDLARWVWNAQLELVAHSVFATQVDHVARVGDASGFAACWVRPGSQNGLYQTSAIVFDPSLQPRWQTQLPESAHAGCDITISPGGRAAVLRNGNAPPEVVRLRSDGSVITPSVVQDVYRMAFSGDEQLWLGLSTGFGPPDARLIRYDRDQSGAAQQIPLVGPGELAEIASLARSGDAVELLVRSTSREGALRAFRIAADGVTRRPDSGADSPSLRIANIDGGWIMADAGGWTARNVDGSVRWSRSVSQDAAFACRSDGSCIRAEALAPASTATSVTTSDATGQDLSTVSLPVDEQVQQVDSRGDELRVVSRDNNLNAYQLYHVRRSDGSLQLLARSAPMTALQLVSIANDQLVVLSGDDTLNGWGLNTLLWSTARDHSSALDNAAASLWQLPRSDSASITGSLGPFDANGQLHWLRQPAPFVVSRVRRPQQLDAEAPAIVGSPTGTSWIAGQIDRGRQRVQLAIIDNNGQRQRLLDLPDALAPVAALADHAGAEAAVIAYPAATADGEPTLRLRQVQHRLFRDGLELN